LQESRFFKSLSSRSVSSSRRLISLLSLYKLIEKTSFSLRRESSRKAGLDISRISTVSILEGGGCLRTAFRAGNRSNSALLVVASCFSIFFRSTTSWLVNDFICRVVILLLSLAREEESRATRSSLVEEGLEVTIEGRLSCIIALSSSFANCT